MQSAVNETYVNKRGDVCDDVTYSRVMQFRYDNEFRDRDREPSAFDWFGRRERGGGE